MIKSEYLIIFLLFLSVSCKSDLIDELDDLSGRWKLTEMSYTDSQGAFKTISDSKTILILTEGIATGNQGVDGARYGIQDVGVEEFHFQYSIDFSQGYIDLLFPQVDKGELPIDAIGRVQVYQFRQIDKSHIEFFVNEEVDYAKGEFAPLKNVRYIFKKE
jgi:hypothetical protein